MKLLNIQHILYNICIQIFWVNCAWAVRLDWGYSVSNSYQRFSSLVARGEEPPDVISLRANELFGSARKFWKSPGNDNAFSRRYCFEYAREVGLFEKHLLCQFLNIALTFYSCLVSIIALFKCVLIYLFVLGSMTKNTLNDLCANSVSLFSLAK